MDLGEPIAKGNTAKVYLRGGKIIKVFREDLPDTEAEREAHKQRHAYACGLPVPYLHEVARINGSWAIVMEHIAGRTIGDLILEDRSTAERYMGLSVDVQRSIHAVRDPDVEGMVDKLRRQIASVPLPLLPDRQKNALLEKLCAIGHDRRLCHGDFHVFNLIFREDRVTILDWVDASAGDVRADACRTYLLYSQFSTDLADLYLRLYCDKSGCRQDEIFLWAPIIAGARLSENVSGEKASRLVEIVNQSCE